MSTLFLDAQDEAAILVMTPEGAVAVLQELETTLDSLVAVIERETELVRAGALIQASDLEAEKARLAGAYMRLRTRVKANAAALARHAPEGVAELKRRHEDFAKLLKVNLGVLGTAREVAEDIVRNVSKAVGRHSAPRTYGPGSVVQAAPGAAARGLALDRRL